MTLKKYIISFTLLALTAVAFGQPRSFSQKPEVFIKEFNKFIASEGSKESDEVMKRFTTKWDSAQFVEIEQRNIINVANRMLNNDLRIPSFVLFTETMLYAKDSIEQAKYISWSKALIPAISNGNKTFLTLLTASRNLFKDNVLYSSETKTWYSSGDNYRFIFKDNRVQISFRDIDLICQAHVDKLVILQTSGSYFLDTDEWEGTKGKVTWERVGFGPDNIYAEIEGKYKLRFDKAELNVDTVLFTNKDFLTNSLYGSLKDRASSADHITKEKLQKSKFPQFVSFKKNIELGSYLDNSVRFTGGYAMKGSEIIANGSPQTPSSVVIDYKNKPRIVAKSEYFSLKEGKITALQSEVTINTDSGRIYHPKLNFNLNLEKKVLVLTRGKNGLEQAPFFNNDHEIEIFVDQVVWRLDIPQIEFDMTGEESKAIIESKDFYKDIRYEKIPRGMLKYHPLSKMRDFVIKHHKREFTFTEYADWMGSKQIYLKPQIIELADYGYLFFNPSTDSIKVRKKLDHAVLAHMELVDYDVIRFSSVISARSNAFLNLINNTFVIEGVRAFRFSDSQSVYAFPHEQKVILKNKRRMEFGGKVTGGKFDFYSTRFDFDYYNFDISSDKIDSMVIYTEDQTGRARLVAVKSVLRDINGTLEIDKSTNKSGLEDYPEYPRFTSRKGAIIAYDKKSIHGGVYDKDQFRFEVDPFTVENIDRFTTSELSFPGTFVSGGIIPEFRYEAKIMDDYSLGFEKVSPPGGYPMYGGKGQGEIDVKLSEEGFTAKGTIEYEGALISSQDILLTPDYTMAAAESYTVKEDSKYPNVIAKDVLTKWVPNNDSLYINTNGHTVQVLRDDQEFQGNLVQTSTQIAGTGILTWDNAKLTSKDMKFEPNKVNADESQIEIGSISGDKIAFASYNVESHVDFTTRIGEFKANEKGKLTDFPFNAYASSMDEYTWDMDAQTIELNKGPLLAQEKSYFISKKPDQQGLRFESTNALFDMKLGIIYAEKVPYIDVADSRVFPFDGKVELRENADMQRLKQSEMLAARDNKNHELFDGDLKIGGRYVISGSSYYEYKDKHNTGQVIFFNKMRVKGKGDTAILVSGFIKDSTGFAVSPKIGFKGKTQLHSDQEDLVFNGYVKPLHSIEEYPSAWFRYNQQPDPMDIIVPAYTIKNEDQRKMYATVSVANDSIHIYPTMFNFKRSYADLELTTDTGVFFYDEAKQQFFVGDSMKLLEGGIRGSYLSFNDATGEIYSEGKIDFGMDIDNNFSGAMAGNMNKMPGDSTFVINSILALNLRLPEDAYDRMIAVITEDEDNPLAENNNAFVKSAMAEYLNDKQLKKALEMTASTGEIKPIGELDRNIFISNMSLHYSPRKKKFLSYDPVHIATINGKQVNRAIDSRIAITKRRSSTRYTFYFEISKYDWFYVDYYLGSVTVASTDKEFNDIIKLQGPKMNKGKFRIRTASARTVANFLTKIEPVD
ncbi:MAG: hypothetical protein COA58_01060 [Bacteroidetes bacterium]|nr:MAG: hypothetical protein COA58_01060 [Bacteroidota bacterium]